MKKYLIIFVLFILSLILPVSTTYADTVLLACPQIMRSNTTELVYDAPLTASRLPEMRDWDRESTSLEILYCESPNWVPYTDLMSIGYTLGINRLGVNEETDYADYSEESVLKPFGNGRAYFRGTPYGGSSNPAMTLIDKAGSCEIVFGAGVGPTEAGTDLYVRSKPTAPMLAEHQRNAERMTKEMTEAINKLKADIAANQELAEFCAVDGTPDKPPAITAEDEQKEQFEEPAGKGIGEFIRKIQSLRLNPFDKPQDQIGSTEQKTPDQTIDDWIMENDLISDPAQIEQLERERQELYRKTPQMTEEMIKKAQEEWKLTTELMRTAPKFEYVLEGEWPDVKSVPWDTESGAVIKSDSWQGVYIEELADRVTKTVIFREGEMEVKVINKNPVEDKVKVVVDDFFDIFVIQTHFRVEYDPGKKLGVVNVYEGEVEVKTKDGKTIRVKPEGDNPGTVVISKKLSIAKLAIVSVIAVASIGGLVWFIRKKIAKQGRKRRS